MNKQSRDILYNMYEDNKEFFSDKPSPEVIDEYLALFFQGEVNTTGMRAQFFKYFIPSRVAKRSYLYLQMLAQSDFPKKYFTKRSGINSYLLAYTYAGEGVLKYEGKQYNLKLHDGFLIDCRMPHEYYANSANGWGYTILHFDGWSMPDYYAAIEQLNAVAFHFEYDSSFAHHINALIEHNKVRHIGTSYEVLNSCLLINLITEVLLTLPLYEKKQIPEKIASIANYIERHFSERITLNSLSNMFYISKYHMAREFRKYIGTTPNEFLTAVRIENAKKLLQFTDMGTQEICEKVGVASGNHLLYMFKKMENITPSEYRKEMRGGFLNESKRNNLE